MAKIDNELQFIVENALNDKMSLIEKSESRYRNIIDLVCEKINHKTVPYFLMFFLISLRRSASGNCL